MLPCFLQTEIPGSFLSAMIVDRFGRKLSMASMLFTSCVFLFPLVFSRTDILTRISLFGARLCISASFTIVYIYAPEVSEVLVQTSLHSPPLLVILTENKPNSVCANSFHLLFGFGLLLRFTRLQ